MRTTWLGLIFLGTLVSCSASSAGGSSGERGPDGSPGVPASGDHSTGDIAASSGSTGAGYATSTGTGTGTGAGTGLSVGTGTSMSTSTAASTSSSSSGSISTTLPPANLLTAGIWDDNLNYDFFTKYLAAHPQLAGDPGFTQADHDASHAEAAQRAAHTVVDAALVIDTTGSMGDELSYLTSEFASISSAISAAFPNADQRWALVLYRDTAAYDPNDVYVVKTVDFTSNMATFASTVATQTTGDGGDYPEADELGLAALPKLSWRTGSSVAKLAFWVGDAPHHVEHAAAMKQAIVNAHTAGIHLYPVAASGADDLLELTMRTAAEITTGRYLFLTDDSGIGDTHKIPEIPCYYVSKLSRALVRVASMELSGTYIGPDPADIIRTSGDPTAAGTCTTQDGQIVQIF